MTSPTAKTSSPDRFQAMDGLRGVAAALILVHHVELTKGQTSWFMHGYLAVDLFFVLSGFVIGHAYEERLRRGMGMAAFARQRLIRLYPLIALGAVVGFIGAVAVRRLPGAGEALALQLLFIPVLWRTGDVFLVNGVQWSLLFELIANLAHAASVPWLTTRLLAGVVAFAAGLLALTAWGFGSLGVGWGSTNFLGGFARVLFSYGAGLLVYRLYRKNLLPRRSAPWWLLAAAPFVLAFVAGRLGWTGDLAAAYLFPLLVAACVYPRLPARAAKAAAFVGMLSYPVYALQGPIKLLMRDWILPLPSPLEAAGWAAYAAILALAAWASVRAFDEPVRRWLNQSRTAAPAL